MSKTEQMLKERQAQAQREVNRGNAGWIWLLNLATKKLDEYHYQQHARYQQHRIKEVITR